MTYKQAKTKLLLEDFFMFPFVSVGKLYGRFFPIQKEYKVFLFFPNADIGGAPRVNAEIVQCLKDQPLFVIFSKKYNNNQFRPLFNANNVKVIDLHKRIDNKAFHFINFFYRGVIATWINSQKKTIVFGGESIFFYKIIPHVQPHIPCIELTHMNTWLPYNIGFIDRINLRIFSTENLKQEVEKQYKENNLRFEYFEKLMFIENPIDIPEFKKTENANLEVVFIGRGSPQKRVHLSAAIAEKMHQANELVNFSFVGDVERIIDITKYPYCKFYGNVTDEELIKQIYYKSDVLLLTSAFEGLPLVVMQAMAYGKVVVSTAVNGIPDYIGHMRNGLLITATDEDKIVDEGVQLLRLLINDPALKTRLGQQSREIAEEKFSSKAFCNNYRNLLLGEGTKKG